MCLYTILITITELLIIDVEFLEVGLLIIAISNNVEAKEPVEMAEVTIVYSR